MPSLPSDITWKLHLASSSARVFTFLSTQQGREAFWAEEAPVADGYIHFTFANGQACRSRIIAREPYTMFAIEYFDSIARFTLADDGSGGTDLTMTNTQVPPEEYRESHAGWLSGLLALKAAVDFGVDLRNHDKGRTWDQRYVDN